MVIISSAGSAMEKSDRTISWLPAVNCDREQNKARNKTLNLAVDMVALKDVEGSRQILH
jgi:hypothetical protein